MKMKLKVEEKNIKLLFFQLYNFILIYFFYSFIIIDFVYNGEGGEYLVNMNMSVCLELG